MGIQLLSIEFSKISYTIRNGEESTELLHNLDGYFESGKLSAILGPSGAGKTLLLNVLAGCNINYENGSVFINGKLREICDYRSICSYIMQETLLQPHLTVLEAVMIVSRLKVDGLTKETRRENVQNILETLGIADCAERRSELLSGGERKRLCIALEIISNPSILIFDEPTTGLDNHSAKLVMQALKRLAAQGHTIICSVHQPPPVEFLTYDYVYFIAKGTCVFSGPPNRLVPFLQEANMPCPITYSPADYLIELVQLNPETITPLATATAKEQNLSRRKNQMCQNVSDGDSKLTVVERKFSAPPVGTKILILLHRMFLQYWRDRQKFILFVLAHFLLGILTGITYFEAGHNVLHFKENAKLAVAITIFIIFPHVMIHIMHIPLHIKIVRQEYSNGWYNEFTYFAAVTISNIPVLLTTIVAVTLPIYLISSQPLELYRITYFYTVAFLSGFCSESLGILIGTLVNVRNGSILGPTVLAAFFVVSCHGMGGIKALNRFWIVVMQFSFMRHAQVGLWVAILGLNRQPLDCDEVFCPWNNPKELLSFMGAVYTSPWVIFGSLILNIILFRILGYYATRYKLRGRIPRLPDLFYKFKKLFRLHKLGQF